MSFYNASQPINIQSVYTSNNVVEFLIKIPTSRALKSGSLRLSGYLKVKKTSPAGVTTSITEKDKVFLNQYAGVHSFFSSITSSINNRSIEGSLMHYPRYVAMMTQHDSTPEGLITNSAHASELKGCLNNYLLPGNNELRGISFSCKPHICLNKSSTDLPQSKFSEMKITIQLANATECLYISGGAPSTQTISSLSYELSDLQLSWMETLEQPGMASEQTVFNCIDNMAQTITGVNSNMQIRTSKPYNAMSISFLRQADKDSIYKDSLLCEYVPDIERVEILVNGVDNPITYAILPPCYQDIALNYYKSLSNSGAVIWKTQTGEKNSIMNRFLSENGTFGVGCAFATSQNDVLQVALTINDNTLYNPSVSPIQAFIYINSFVEV